MKNSQRNEIFNPTNVEKNALLPFLKARYFIILSSKEIKSYKKQTYLAILSLGRTLMKLILGLLK